GPPGEVIVPEPPYWFGKKGRGTALPMPRETPVRLTLAADLPPGPVYWQAANANGATVRGVFLISNVPEVVEAPRRTKDEIQTLPTLPVAISGQVKKIEEVDRYRFRAAITGPVTCQIFAKRLNSQLRAILEIRDHAGQIVADVADTEHRDPAVSFTAKQGEEYTISLYDLDFRGDRSLTYRLQISPQPPIVAAIPAFGKRGETRPVTFVGRGIVTGSSELELITQNVTFPADAQQQTWDVPVETPYGKIPFRVSLSDSDQAIEPDAVAIEQRILKIPGGLTGVLAERYGEDRYVFDAEQGKPVWIEVESMNSDAALDLSLTILDAKEQSVGANDDLPGTTNAGLLFTPAATGRFQLVISDASGLSGTRSAVYHVALAPPKPNFEVKLPEQIAVLLGTKVPLTVTIERREGFVDPVKITLAGLPVGMTVPGELIVAKGANDVKVELASAADSPAIASLVTATATAEINGQVATKTASPVLVAVTMKPPFSIDAGGKDDVSKWPRGTAFPAPVLIERNPGFDGEIRLEMAGFNDRHRQGIRGPEMMVPPGVKQVTYPVTLPEWLETTRTSRIVLNGVVKVPDPKGNQRHLVSRLLTRIGFLPGGALLKVAHHAEETKLDGNKIRVPIVISRSSQLTAPVKLQLKPAEDNSDLFQATSVELNPTQTQVEFAVETKPGAAPKGRHEFTIQASTLKDGTLPVISETTVTIEFPN
ncbi:MAG: hypothetical protein JWM11_7364, partial [Planctomycetaceae bacterium]|nr:hypothetical protein [Planctomycetaceae bacterium]